MEPTTSAQPVTPTFYKRTLVVRTLDVPLWGNGNKAKNLQLAMLEWGMDGRIRLHIVDPATESIRETVLDCALSEIESVHTNLLEMYIWFKERESFKLDFSDEAIDAAANGKDLRSSNFYVRNFFISIEEKSLRHDTGNDIQWWVWNLTRAGVASS